jgi:hypothetical protein
LGFWPRSFVQICAKSCQTCLGADYTWLTQLNMVFIFNKQLGCYRRPVGSNNVCVWQFFPVKLPMIRHKIVTIFYIFHSIIVWTFESIFCVWMFVLITHVRVKKNFYFE